MAIESICSGCGNTLSVADENAGKRARCPACGHIYTIPSLSDSPTSNGPSPLSADSDDSAFRSSDQSTLPEATPPEANRYWMRAVDGTEYGPVDQATLERWFREGRVGPGYQLRQSQYGNWQPADVFRPVTLERPANPFSDAAAPNNPYQAIDPTSGRRVYPKGDQGVLILVMGVLGIFCCPIFGVAAWIMGHSALHAIQAGEADPNTKGLVQIGYYLGIVSVVLFLLCSGGRLISALIEIMD